MCVADQATSVCTQAHIQKNMRLHVHMLKKNLAIVFVLISFVYTYKKKKKPASCATQNASARTKLSSNNQIEMQDAVWPTLKFSVAFSSTRDHKDC